jgi:hypothetical protein
LNRLFENASADLPERKCRFIGVFTNGFWYFIWKILTGESHPKARLTLFQYSRYNSEQVLRLLVCIMKLQLKRIDLNRTVFGIYRTTAFCNQHDHWGDNSRTVKENIETRFK